jgi:hypothetical protein
MRACRMARVIAITALLAGCSSSVNGPVADSSSDGAAAATGIPLRSVGVHLNGDSGLLTLIAHDVVLDDGAFPEITVGYAFAGEGVADIPE